MIARKVLDKNDHNHGLDAQLGEFNDLMKSGIIDPTKELRIGHRQTGPQGRGLSVRVSGQSRVGPATPAAPLTSPRAYLKPDQRQAMIVIRLPQTIAVRAAP